jgi:catechol 2,3-dioxygenase-like lactoylglutathione lyase family enzyme
LSFLGIVMTASRVLQEVIVGVRDMDRALSTWVGSFGFELIATARSDSTLGAWLGVAPNAVARASLLALNAAHARVLLVEFQSAALEDVRAGAAPTDHCPKNLDVLTRDVAASSAALAAAGAQFRSAWVEYPVDEQLCAREVQMFGHDSTNIGLLELKGQRAPFNAAGFAGLTTVVCTNPDPDAEQAFFTEVLGFHCIRTHRLGGPQIEQMIGLAPGGELDFRLFGRAEDLFGRVELVHYSNTVSADLYPRTHGMAIGTLGITVRVEALAPVRAAARESGISWRDLGPFDHLLGAGDGLALCSPAGLRVWVYRCYGR